LFTVFGFLSVACSWRPVQGTVQLLHSTIAASVMSDRNALQDAPFFIYGLPQSEGYPPYLTMGISTPRIRIYSLFSPFTPSPLALIPPPRPEPPAVPYLLPPFKADYDLAGNCSHDTPLQQTHPSSSPTPIFPRSLSFSPPQFFCRLPSIAVFLLIGLFW